MKRSFMSVIALLLLVVAAPLTIAAQDSKAVWELTESLKLNDQGLSINYPSGWVSQETEGKGVFIAENDADLAAVTDDDATTLAAGSSIQLIATKVENLNDLVGENPTLDQVADVLVKNFGVTEKEKRAEVPVVAHRSLSVLGENEAKQGLILTIWRQNDSFMGIFLTSPSYDDTLKLSYSFGQVLGSIVPVDAMPLSESTISLPTTGSEISFPDGWFVDPKTNNWVYELESDIGKDTFEGFKLSIAEIPLADAQLPDTATVSDVVDGIIANLGFSEPVAREEFILLGQPALNIRGSLANGQFALTSQAVVNGTIVQIAVIGADEEKVTAFEPTFLTVLKSLKPVKTS